MIRTPKRMKLCVALLILNVAFIWGNSLLPGEISGKISGFVRDMIDRIFPNMDLKESGNSHGLLRKIAHLTEFMALGVLASWLFRMTRRRRWEFFAWPLLTGVATASLDETIQCFVPDRGPAVLDVCIDSTGVLLGMAVLSAAVYFHEKKR